jgi:hypothetical protein
LAEELERYLVEIHANGCKLSVAERSESLFSLHVISFVSWFLNHMSKENKIRERRRRAEKTRLKMKTREKPNGV